MDKICPIMTRCDNPKADLASGYIIVCQHEHCQLWISGYTSEKLLIRCCAFEFMALKNSEGNYTV